MLSHDSCKRHEARRLSAQKLNTYLEQCPGWQKLEEGVDKIQCEFQFNDYTSTVEFVMKVAKVAEQEDHHPEITFSYKSATIKIHTHSVKGLSLKDFIFAAKLNTLYNSN